MNLLSGFGSSFPRLLSRRLVSHCVFAAALVLSCFAPGGRPARAYNTIQEMIDAAPIGGTVNIPPGTYTESLLINKNLNLVGHHVDMTTIQAPAGKQAIRLVAGANTVSIQNMTITGANVPSLSGGGIYAQNSELHIIDCKITNNKAMHGGGVHLEQGSLIINGGTIHSNEAVYHGGGIYANGQLSLSGTMVSLNKAGNHGGGVHSAAGLVTVNGGTFDGNSASMNGGGLNLNDDLWAGSATFKNNTAGRDGGGVLQWNPGKTITMIEVFFSNNTAAQTGGGMWAKGNMTVTGGRFLQNVAGKVDGTFDSAGGGLLLQAGALTLRRTTFQENKALCGTCPTNPGGGLALLNSASNLVENAVFQANEAWNGGGLYFYKRLEDPTEGRLTVQNSTFLNNIAGYGGGLFAGNVTVRDSLFEGNTGKNDGGGLFVTGDNLLERTRILANKTIYSYSMGAGLYIYYGATVRNSVINENIHTSGSTTTKGSGICVDEDSEAPVILHHVTISHNTGGNGAGLHLSSSASSASLTNVIIANQGVGVCVEAGAADIDGVLWHNNTNNTGGPGCPVSVYVNSGSAKTGDPAFAPDGYHLTGGSAAIDAGVFSGLPDDLDRDKRLGQADLGADEISRVYLPLTCK